MADLQIIPSTLEHVRELSKTLRYQDRLEAERLGLKPNVALYYSYRHATLRRTALIDGRVAAMWGICGTPLGLVGQPYLVTSPEVYKISSIRFSRIYRDEVKAMSLVFPILENYVDASYDGAVGMLKIAGFTLSDSIDYHGNTFYKFTLSKD